MNDIRILIPVYNDWPALGVLLPLLNDALGRARLCARILVVDDGSSTSIESVAVGHAEHLGFRSIGSIRVLRLRRNLGHQRAIAVGLCFLAREMDDEPVVVMDADGEDRPSDVVRLLAMLEETGQQAVFARRMRRSEGLAFTIFYQLYRFLHYVLTGIPVQIGNFSALRASAVRSIVTSPDLWNHYAAAMVKARIPAALAPTSRGRRLAGTRSMNFSGLVAHGLSAMSVFSDRIGVRLLAVASGLVLIFTTVLIATFAVRRFRPLSVPEWATAAGGLLLVLILQSLLLAFVFAFMVQQGRSASAFIPARDHELFIEGVHQLAILPLSRSVAIRS